MRPPRPMRWPPVTAAPRRGGAAGRRGRRFRVVGQPAPDPGGADRAVVHRTGCGTDRGRPACAPCGAAAALPPGRREGSRRRRPGGRGQPHQPHLGATSREQILALRRPGRIVVVDEAFADSVPGEPESLAGVALPDVLVLRSLTKTWSLAGLRVGYALGPRRCWPG
ncbi:aminotransferase class I and II family protein [Mycobacterium xenopi 3993]|nr:aminotransferase class I and II family protein [Mycobacterium xenopi 3993]